MKKLGLLLAVLYLVSIVMAACSRVDNDDVFAADEQGSGTVGDMDRENVPSIQSAEYCMLGVLNADSAEALDPSVTENSDIIANRILQLFPDDHNYTVEMKKLGSYKEHDAYECTIRNRTDPNYSNTTVELLLRKDSGYEIETNQDIISEIASNCICPGCGGAGFFSSGGNVCGICGGTGQQYYPAVYFDVALQMWQGQFQACSGCAGAGRTGFIQIPCSICHGICYVFG